jgi:dihydropteroate synthase
MGIINVTPDSFSDGGRYTSANAAIDHALELVQQGADLLDIGGESSRPGAEPVKLEVELQRVLPIVSGLATRTNIPLSIDTCKTEVARQCLDAGAHVINDITALTDPAMAAIVRHTRAGAVLMHMQGTPATMQQNPQYQDVVEDICRYFEERLQVLTNLGIAKEQLVLDPGIGFGKRSEHNLRLLARLDELHRFGRPLCLGVSRKGFLGKMLDRPITQRLAGSLAAACFALHEGSVQILRVHDVAETRDVVTVIEALKKSPPNARGSV